VEYQFEIWAGWPLADRAFLARPTPYMRIIEHTGDREYPSDQAPEVASRPQEFKRRSPYDNACWPTRTIHMGLDEYNPAEDGEKQAFFVRCMAKYI
jgi:hypothetical protein